MKDSRFRFLSSKALDLCLFGLHFEMTRAHMSKTATIRACIEPDLKAQVEGILDELGLTMTEAITLFLSQVAFQRRLPLDVALPNALAMRTFRETDRGENVVRCESLEDLFEKLEI